MAEKTAKPAEKAVQAVQKPAKKTRDIGLGLPLPEGTCDDIDCPYHGRLPVRGRIIECTVVSNKMNKTAVVKREFMRILPKYERYEKRTNKYSAHNPPCIAAEIGDEVTIAECRPLSKTVSFVIVRRKK